MIKSSLNPPKEPYTERTIIDSSVSTGKYWKELIEFRELIYFLSWRDILVRYKQTAIGILWSVIRPLMLMGVLTIVFGTLANLSQQTSAPYPLIVLVALLPWQFFSCTLADGVESLVKNQAIISKLYFPRLIVPLSSNVVTFLDFLVSLALLAVGMLYYQFLPNIRCLCLPLFVLLLGIFSFGTSLWVSALTVKYRDFRILIPFAIQFGLYVTPVGFISSIVPEKWRLLYSLNPMVGIIDGFRWALLDLPLYWPTLLISIVFSLAILLSGVVFFQKFEKNFADII